jgi:prolyl 4-hydroxylase
MKTVIPTSSYRSDNFVDNDKNDWKKHSFTFLATCLTFLLAYRLHPSHNYDDTSAVLMIQRVGQIPNQPEEPNSEHVTYPYDRMVETVSDASLLLSTDEQKTENSVIQDFQIPISFLQDTNQVYTNLDEISSSVQDRSRYQQTKDHDSDYDNTSSTEHDTKINTIASKKFKRMSGYNTNNMKEYFDAYVRDDVRSFYHNYDDNASHIEQAPDFIGQAGKFINLFPYRISLYWEDPSNGVPVYHGDINAWGSGGSAVFPTHSFIFTKPNQPDEILCRIVVVHGTSVYYCDPFEQYQENDGDDGTKDDPFMISRGIILCPYVNKSSLNGNERTIYDTHRLNLEFGIMYKNVTGGSEWLSMYPYSKKPKHMIRSADYYGQIHTVLTNITQFHTPIPSNEIQTKLSIDEMRYRHQETSNITFSQYRNDGTLNLSLKVLSVEPRIFEIQNFVSDVEVDHLIRIINQQSLERSKTGNMRGQISSTRTSRTTWLSRETDTILNTIYLRAADVLDINEALLRQRNDHDDPIYSQQLDHPSDNNRINEDLQIVHYDIGEQYTAHHDFSFPKSYDQTHTRSINLCLYLNNVTKGGETSFPRWRNGHTSTSLNVQPIKGKAVIFYMITPDGNLDDLTQHAALPVIEGEKYFANLWISSY